MIICVVEWILLVWFPNPLAAGRNFFKSDGDPVYRPVADFTFFFAYYSDDYVTQGAPPVDELR